MAFELPVYHPHSFHGSCDDSDGESDTDSQPSAWTWVYRQSSDEKLVSILAGPKPRHRSRLKRSNSDVTADTLAPPCAKNEPLKRSITGESTNNLIRAHLCKRASLGSVRLKTALLRGQGRPAAVPSRSTSTPSLPILILDEAKPRSLSNPSSSSGHGIFMPGTSLPPYPQYYYDFHPRCNQDAYQIAKPISPSSTGDRFTIKSVPPPVFSSHLNPVNE